VDGGDGGDTAAAAPQYEPPATASARSQTIVEFESMAPVTGPTSASPAALNIEHHVISPTWNYASDLELQFQSLANSGQLFVDGA